MDEPVAVQPVASDPVPEQQTHVPYPVVQQQTKPDEDQVSSRAKKLYDGLMSIGVTKDDIGDFDNFNTALHSQQRTSKLYDGLMSLGVTPVDIGVKDEFLSKFSAPKPVQSTPIPSKLNGLDEAIFGNKEQRKYEALTGTPQQPYSILSPELREEQYKRDNAVKLSKINQEQARQKASWDAAAANTKKIYDSLTPEQKKVWWGPASAAIFDKAPTREPDVLRQTSDEEIAHHKFVDTPLGKVFQYGGTIASDGSHAVVDMAKMVSFLGSKMTSDPTVWFRDSESKGVKEFLNKADEAANLGAIGLTKNDINTVHTGPMGDAIQMGSQIAIGEGLGKIIGLGGKAIGATGLTPTRGVFFLQFGGSGITTIDNIEKSGVKVDPLVKNIFPILTAVVGTLAGGNIGETLLGKVSSRAASKFTSTVAADTFMQAAEKGLAEDATLSLLKKNTQTALQKFEQGSLNIGAAYKKTIGDFAKFQVGNYLSRRVANAETGDGYEKPFNDTPGKLIDGLVKMTYTDAPLFAGIGSIGTAHTMLAPKSQFKNEILGKILENPSEENVDEIKQNLHDYGFNQDLGDKMWTPEQMDATLKTVDNIAKATRVVPASMPKNKEKAVGLVMGRTDLQEQLADMKRVDGNVDESMKDVNSPSQQVLTDKIEQANDKLKAMAMGGNVKYTVNETGQAYKEFPDGTREKITQSRWNMEQNESSASRDIKIIPDDVEPDIEWEEEQRDLVNRPYTESFYENPDRRIGEEYFGAVYSEPVKGQSNVDGIDTNSDENRGSDIHYLQRRGEGKNRGLYEVEKKGNKWVIKYDEPASIKSKAFLHKDDNVKAWDILFDRYNPKRFDKHEEIINSDKKIKSNDKEISKGVGEENQNTNEEVSQETSTSTAGQQAGLALDEKEIKPNGAIIKYNPQEKEENKSGLFINISAHEDVGNGLSLLFSKNLDSILPDFITKNPGSEKNAKKGDIYNELSKEQANSVYSHLINKLDENKISSEVFHNGIHELYRFLSKIKTPKSIEIINNLNDILPIVNGAHDEYLIKLEANQKEDAGKRLESINDLWNKKQQFKDLDLSKLNNTDLFAYKQTTPEESESLKKEYISAKRNQTRVSNQILAHESGEKPVENIDELTQKRDAYLKTQKDIEAKISASNESLYRAGVSHPVSEKSSVGVGKMASIDAEIDKVYAELKKKLSSLSATGPFHALPELLKLGGLYAEKGILKFADFVRELRFDYKRTTGKDLPLTDKEIARDVYKPSMKNVVNPRINDDPVGQRGFGERVVNDADTPQEAKDYVSSDPEHDYQKQVLDDIKSNLTHDTEADLLSKMGDVEVLTNINPDTNTGVLAAAEMLKRAFVKNDMVTYMDVFKKLDKAGTTLGQMLRQFAEIKGSSPGLFIGALEKKMEISGRFLTPEQKKDLTDTMGDYIRKSLTAKDKWLHAVETLDPKDIADAKSARKESDLAHIEIAKKMGNYDIAGFWDTATSIMKGNLLTTASQIANPVYNIAFAPLRLGVKRIASVLDGIVSSVFGVERTTTYRINQVQAQLSGFIEGINQASKTVRHGIYPGETTKLDSYRGLRPIDALIQVFTGKNIPKSDNKLQYIEDRYLTKPLEAIFGLPAETMYRLLSMGDKPFYQSAYKNRLTEIANLKKLKGDDLTRFIMNPDIGSAKLAIEAAEEATFQSDKGATKIASLAIGSLNSALKDVPFFGGMSRFAVGSILPFVKTPTNVIAESFSYLIPEVSIAQSGIAIFKMTKAYAGLSNKLERAKAAGASDAMLANIAKKSQKEISDARRDAVFAVSKSIVSKTLQLSAAWLVSKGVFTGTLDDDKKRRALQYEAGRPNSVNISALRRGMATGDYSWNPADEFVSIDKFGMFGGAVSIAGNVKEGEENDNVSQSDYLTDLTYSAPAILKFSLDQSFLKGTNAVMDAVTTGRYNQIAPNMVSAMYSVVTPNTWSAFARANREFMANKKGNTTGESIANVIKEKTYFDPKLPHQIGLWGQDIKQTPEGRNPYVYQLLDITKFNSLTEDPVTNEVINLFHTTHDDSIIPEKPDGDYVLLGNKIKLTPEQTAERQRIVGQRRYQVYTQLISTEGYKESSPELKVMKLSLVLTLSSRLGNLEFEAAYLKDNPSTVQEIKDAKTLLLNKGISVK